MTAALWRLTKGYRLCPWRSPYLRWRVETYVGGHTENMTAADFFRFVWQHRRSLFRFLQWAGRMDHSA